MHQNETATLENPEADDFFVETTLAQVPDDELRCYEMLLKLKNTRIQFASEYHVNSRGEKMSWDYPHILDLYEEVSPTITIQGSTQCMKTEWVVCSHLAAMYCGINVFFVLPKHTMRATYVRNHVDRVIDASSGYKTINGGRAVGSHLKRFGKGATRYVSSNKREDFAEYPADCHEKNTKISLFNGSTKRICDVKIGDTVASFDGNSVVPDKVVNVIKRGVKETLSVKTTDGSELRCTLGTEVFTNSGWKYLYELVRDDCYEFYQNGAVKYTGEKDIRDDLRIIDGRCFDISGVSTGQSKRKEDTKRGLHHPSSILSRSTSNRLLSSKTSDVTKLLREVYYINNFKFLRKFTGGGIYVSKNRRVKIIGRHRLSVDRKDAKERTTTSKNTNRGVSRFTNAPVVGLLVHGRWVPFRSCNYVLNRLLHREGSRLISRASAKVQCSQKEKQNKIKRGASVECGSPEIWNCFVSGGHREIPASSISVQMGQFPKTASLVQSLSIRKTKKGRGCNLSKVRPINDSMYRSRTGQIQAAMLVGDSRKTRSQNGEAAYSTCEIGASKKHPQTTGVLSEGIYSKEGRYLRDLLSRSSEDGCREERESPKSVGRGSKEKGIDRTRGDYQKKKDKSKKSREASCPTKLLNEGGEWVEILSINYHSRVEVWDIQTERLHNFYAEGLLVHNCVIVEELDHCDQENLLFAKDRLSGSPYKFYYRIGNPTIEKFGINEHYLAGDRKKWFVKCCACGKYRAIDWFKHVVRAVVGAKRSIKGYNLRDTEWSPGCHRDIHAICPCGGALMRREGIWHPTKPENYYLGGASYHISSLMSIQRPIEALYFDFQPAISDFRKMEHFYRSVLGLPYSPGDNKVSSSLISESSISGFTFLEEDDMAYIEGDKHEGPCFLGMDVGNSLDVSVIYTNPRGTKILVFCGKLSTIEEVQRVMDRYNVKVAVVDIGPERALVRDFQHISDIPVWLCQYSESASGVSGGLRINNAQREVLTDRTEHLDNVFKGIHSKMIRFPDNYLRIMKGAWYKEMTASTRTLVEAAKGKMTYRWSDLHDDHQFHALAYANLAAKLGGEVMSVYVG